LIIALIENGGRINIYSLFAFFFEKKRKENLIVPLVKLVLIENIRSANSIQFTVLLKINLTFFWLE